MCLKNLQRLLFNIVQFSSDHPVYEYMYSFGYKTTTFKFQTDDNLSIASIFYLSSRSPCV